MAINLTIPVVSKDLLATKRDIKNLKAIVSHLQKFIDDPEGEDRNKFKLDLMRYQVLLENAEYLEKKIAEKLSSLKKSNLSA